MFCARSRLQLNRSLLETNGPKIKKQKGKKEENNNKKTFKYQE